MRHPWRLLLFRNSPRSRLPIPTHSSQSHFQVQSSSTLYSLRALSSLLHTRTVLSQPIFYSQSTSPINPKGPVTRNFSSEPAIEEKDSDHVVVTDIFSKTSDLNDIRKELELNGIVISHEMVLKLLKNLESSPDVAQKFFHWVLESEGETLSSKSYNLMLGILGVNGFLKEFWDLVDTMKKKGYGVSRGVRDKVSEKFEKDGLESHLEKLRQVFASGSVDNSMENICSRVCKIVRSEVWGDNVEGRLRGLNVMFSSDLVRMVLENLGTEPMKALIFFRWIEEGSLFKHDEQTYNAMSSVLGREDCIDRFWKVIDEMRSSGYEMEIETYVKVLGRFCKRKMFGEAVDLYEFAMAGANKPSVHCCTFLLKKIVVGERLDMALFSRVVKVFTECGNLLTDSMLNAVLKSLTSVGRFEECNKVLKAMEGGGFVTSGNLQSEIVFRLSSAGKKNEACEFMDHVEASGINLGHKTWASLIKGHCVSGDLKKASDCFREAVGKEVSCAGYIFEILVNAYCRKNRAIDAYELLHGYVSENQLKPWHTTYKLLIKKLLVQGRFTDALNLLGLMKDHGFPPFVDPFIEYVSKSGTGDDAVVFLKAMTSNKFPSTSVFLRMFEGFFQAGRHSEAQDFLSKCPGYIRNHADVLNLFCSIKSGEGVAATSMTA